MRPLNLSDRFLQTKVRVYLLNTFCWLSKACILHSLWARLVSQKWVLHFSFLFSRFLFGVYKSDLFDLLKIPIFSMALRTILGTAMTFKSKGLLGRWLIYNKRERLAFWLFKDLNICLWIIHQLLSQLHDVVIKEKWWMRWLNYYSSVRVFFYIVYCLLPRYNLNHSTVCTKILKTAQTE